MSDLVNKTIKHYKIEKLLGTGGMGAVYRATDLQLQRPVAIKIMHAQFAARTEFQERFLQEARAAARLDHPNIIKIWAFDLEDNTLYMVAEFVAGGSLRDYLKTLYEARKFIEIREAVTLTRQVAEALDYAHANGMIHRDVKPDNILLKLVTSGSSEDMPFRAVLTDFGLAKLAEGGVQSISDNPMGTLPYMSPEQAQVEKLDGRTDIYALGVMLYELTTGRLPFMPRNIVEAIKMHTAVEPDKPSAVRSSVSKPLEDVILKAMAKRREDRYQTGGEFARALRQLETMSAPGTSAPPLVQAPPEQINSISTYLQSMALPVEAPKGAIPAADLSQSMDRIVIVQEGQQPRFIPINKQTMTIGRDPDLDIVLTGEGVSRNHARIERRKDGQYQIMDIGSTNGTYLGEAKLLSNIPERWDPEKTVRVGKFYLSVQISQHTGTERQVQEVRRSADASVVSAGSFISPAVGGDAVIQQAGARPAQVVGLTLNPATVNVDAGGRAATTLEVLNQSDIVEHYRLQVQGIPPEWVTVGSGGIQLMPASKGSMPISFGPPRNPKSTAGAHNFDVRVSSEERGTELGRISGILVIAPYFQFDCDMSPKRIKNSGLVNILINNRGNAPESFTVSARDREEAAHFDPPIQQVSINAGLGETVPFFARAKNRPLFGGSKSLQLEFNSAAASGTDRTLNGELWVSPIIPAWIIPLLVMMCIICIAVILMLQLLVFGPQAQTQTAAAGVTSNRVTDAYTTLKPWLTGTAQSFDKRQTNTAIYNAGATATAVIIGTQAQQATQNRADTLTAIAKNDAATASAAAANKTATQIPIDTATSLAATLAKH